MKKSDSPNYRPDIDGLRALAIILVVFFHGFPDLCPGGFIGVDVFFVISGYLISSIILEEIRGKKFSFLNFYARRCRRILPALALVLSIVLVVGLILLLPNELERLGQHIIYGALFSSNMLLFHETGYFDTAAEAKPLLHLWSLGVEEQYYIFWPVILYGFIKLRWNLIALMLGIFVASFAAGLMMKQSAAFYLIPSRFWELLVGGLLVEGQSMFQSKASITSPKNRLMRGLAYVVRMPASCHFISLLGLGLIVFSAFKLNKDASFPKWNALMPTLGGALLILAGRSGIINRFVFSNPVMIWVGLISYPLYLWHWPLLSYGHILYGNTLSSEIAGLLIIFAVVLALLTWRLVEIPVQTKLFTNLLPIQRAQYTVVGGILMLSILITLGGLIVFQRGFPQRFPDHNMLLSDIDVNAYNKYVASQKNAYDICKDYRPEFDGWCLASTEKATFALLGDSHAEHYVPGILDHEQGRSGWIYLGHPACPPTENVNVVEVDIDTKCSLFNKVSLKLLNAHPEIKTVVLASLSVPYVDNLPSSKYSRDGRFKLSSSIYKGTYLDIFTRGTTQIISDLQSMGKRVVLIVDDPEMPFDITHCISRNPFRDISYESSSCHISEVAYKARAKDYLDMIASLKNHFPTLLVYDATNMYCEDDKCSPWSNGRSLYRDSDHLSIYGSKAFADRFIPWLEAQP